jgi:hypothetical protein
MRPKNERRENPAAEVGEEEVVVVAVVVVAEEAGHAAGKPLTGSGATRKALTTFL